MDSDDRATEVAPEALLRAVLEGCGEGLCIVDETGDLVALNRAAAELLGYSEEQLRGLAILPDLGLSPAAAASSTPEERGVARWRRRDGSLVALRCRIEPVPAAEPRRALLHLEPVAPPAGAACDIESNFRAILDTITDGVIVIDEAGIIQLLNPAAERLFGYRREQMVGQNVAMLMPSPDSENHDQYLDNYRRTHVRKIIGIGREVTGQRRDGSTFPMYLSIGELLQGDQRLFVGVTRDLTARRQTEDKLLVLSRAVDQSPVAIIITGMDGCIEYVNRGFSRLTGYSAAEVIGRHARQLHAGRTAPEENRSIWETLRAGKEWHGEIQDRKKDGDLYWALETITPIRDVRGKVSRYLAMRQDITQQKRDREALQESEGRFRLVAEMVGEWLWEQDAGGHYTYSSAAVEAILGYRPEEILGKHFLDLMTAEDRARWLESLPPAEHAKASFTRLVNHYRHRDGHEVFTESTGAPVVDEQGRVSRWRGMDLDITDRKRFEDALRLRDRAIEAANVGIAIADARVPNYPNIYVNPALCRITGYSREELLGRSLRLLQGPETDPEARAKIRKALDERESCEVVLRNYRKDGTAFWNELLLSPVQDESGATTHYIGIQTDVSERRRAEEERHELEIAKQIQLSLLPKAPLRLHGIEVAGVCLPATHVGGDYFDFFSYGGNVDLVIADVSGHSVGAALIMAEMRSTLKAEIRRDRHRPAGTADILNALNDVLYGDLSGAELFITMFYLRYELETRRLRYANAGHNRALLLRRKDSGCIQLDADGLILGIKREVAFEEKGLVLQPGDMLLLYTDGVTEAQNDAGEFFGLSRLCGAFCAHRAQPSEALLQALLGELREFRGKGDFQDDISMVAVRLS
jgi:sigma-B regulation protein RsbU (phosphoserine phosphatase)